MTKSVTGVLSTRRLNRTLLARQLLLRRESMSADKALEHLVGMQAQVPNAPYIGLWTRLESFDPDDLSRLISTRRAVRIVVMRGTIHLVTARDCLTLRPLTQPVLERAVQAAFGRQLAGLDLEKVLAAGRALLEQEPRTFVELGRLLAKRWPGRDAPSMAHAVRALVPLVQVPPRGLWGTSGAAVHEPAERWLGRPWVSKPSLEKVILRYLAAFGPATIADVQAWSGLTKLREPIDRLRKRLRTFRSETGDVLFDVPDDPLADPDAEAPPRFLPVLDNVMLSHADRSRIMSGKHRTHVLALGAGLLMGPLLVDGFIGGRWEVSRGRTRAILIIRPFKRLQRQERAAIEEEGDRFVRFVAADYGDYDVRFQQFPA